MISRWLFMLFGLLVLLTACATVGENGTRLSDVPLQDYDVIARGGTPVTPDSFVVDVGGGRRVRLNFYNPSPTATLPSISTPTPTMAATATPSPTMTAMPPESPTPTMEVTILPTITNGPPKTCSVKAAKVINIRDQPGLSGSKVTGALAANDTIEISEVQEVDTYLWAHHPRGWSAIRQATTWWVYGVEGQSAICVDVTGWPEGLEPPVPVVKAPLVGLHVLVGSRWDPIADTASAWDAIKTLTDSAPLAQQFKSMKAEAVTVYRPLIICTGMSDGPILPYWSDPQGYYNCIRPYWPEGFDYYEVVNEVSAPGDIAQFTDMMIYLAERAGREGKCILAYSFAPGNPELADWGDILRFMRWSNAHPCGTWMDGTPRYHGIALHQPGYMPPEVPLRADSWVNNSWVAGRDVLIDNLLRQAHGFSLADFQGGIWLTEWGYVDGYSGSWEDRWTCEQMAAGLEYTRQVYEARPWMRGFFIWTLVSASGTRWTDVTACLPDFRTPAMIYFGTQGDR